MSAWPDTMKTGSIREWPGEFTRTRAVAPFTRPAKWVDGKRVGGGPVPLSTTLRDLDRELRMLRAANAELLVAIPVEKFTRAGRPYAGAHPEHPGVILSFEIPSVGTVSYPCDTFTTWESNLRAITLSLEALRKVDRYGVTKRAEQYRGFLAIEATVAPAGFSSAKNALDFIEEVAGIGPVSISSVATVLRRAQRETHPDAGGDAAMFQRVSLAEAKLREEGIL